MDLPSAKGHTLGQVGNVSFHYFPYIRLNKLNHNPRKMKGYTSRPHGLIPFMAKFSFYFKAAPKFGPEMRFYVPRSFRD